MANAFVQRVAPRVKGALRRLLRNRASDHDDLMQVVLVELVTTLHRFKGQCSLNSWVDRITAHVVYKRLRRLKLENKIFEGAVEEALGVPSSTWVSNQVMVGSALKRVQEALEGLNPVRLNAWLLFDVQGFTLEEVAEVLEISVSAAQSQVSRGRRDVRERLEQDPELVGTLEALSIKS